MTIFLVLEELHLAGGISRASIPAIGLSHGSKMVRSQWQAVPGYLTAIDVLAILDSYVDQEIEAFKTHWLRLRHFSKSTPS